MRFTGMKLKEDSVILGVPSSRAISLAMLGFRAFGGLVEFGFRDRI